MRITKINIPEHKIDNGLKHVKMKRLQQVVLLAGKNGAGKTRLLNLISNTIKYKPRKSEIDTIDDDIDVKEKQINEQLNRIDTYTAALETEKNEDNRKAHRLQIASHKERITRFKSQLEKLEESKKWNLIETDELKDDYTITPFIPKGLKLEDSNKFNKNDLLRNSKNLTTVGVASLESGTFARIQVIQDRWFNATHQASTLSKEEKQLAIDDYVKLTKLIGIFLNTELNRNINDEPTLFGFSLGQSNLSDGQKILLQLCLAIHCQNESLSDLVLFMDEPENHLHPSVIIQTIERILEHVTNGQIWISTHSIPLLSHFDPSCIWYVENNKVDYAGSGPEKVLNSLLGDEGQITKLQDFISLPGILALQRHAFESLFHPEVLMTDDGDPQVLQIKDEIKQHLHQEEKIRVLDYGAGKGRLLANIISANKEPISSFNDWFDYVAYDKFDYDKDQCLASITNYDQSNKNRYFNSFPEIFSTYDKGSFDVIVMCNVLHEIDPIEWLSLFSPDGYLAEALSDKGILLIVEDQVMPIGEKAYQNGFIVLDTPELKDLFCITETDKDFGYSDARNDGRLKAHRIKKEYFTRISNESRITALTALNKKACQNVIDVRKEEVNYPNGKIHGFWLQQYANTSLALNQLK